MVKYFYGCDLCVIIKSEKKYNDINENKFFIAKIWFSFLFLSNITICDNNKLVTFSTYFLFINSISS